MLKKRRYTNKEFNDVYEVEGTLILDSLLEEGVTGNTKDIYEKKIGLFLALTNFIEKNELVDDFKKGDAEIYLLFQLRQKARKKLGSQ